MKYIECNKNYWFRFIQEGHKKFNRLVRENDNYLNSGNCRGQINWQ